MSQRSGAERLFTNMLAFLQAPTWDGSKRIILSHPELMNDAGYQMLRFMISDRETVSWIYPGVDPGHSNILIQLHYVVLGRSRQIGIREAFAELDEQIGPVESDAEEKALLPLSDFLTAEGPDEALSVLREHPGLADAAMASLLDRLIAAAHERGDLTARRRLAERRRWLQRQRRSRPGAVPARPGNPQVIAILALLGMAVVASALILILGPHGGPGRGGPNGPPEGLAPTTEPTKRPSPSEAEPSATGNVRETEGTTPPPSHTPAVDGTTRPPSPSPTSRPTTAHPTTPVPNTASPTASLNPSPPQIADVGTYQEGELVFFSVLFSDPDGDAEGFGFRGVNGSTWPEETHPFSSPGLGRVGPGRVDYPFDLGCGTYYDFELDLEVWIYDSTGSQSASVVVHLACEQGIAPAS